MAARTKQPSCGRLAAISTQLAGSCCSVLQDHLARLRRINDHPNRVLHYDQPLTAHLIGFYDGVVRSLRTLDGRSTASDQMREALDGLHGRSTPRRWPVLRPKSTSGAILYCNL